MDIVIEAIVNPIKVESSIEGVEQIILRALVNIDRLDPPPNLFKGLVKLP